MGSLNKVAEARGLREEVVAILQGMKPEDMQLAMADMPLASAPGAFSYESEDDPAQRLQPFARGLVDGMLNMPVESR